ncbi:ankyrin repeat domain-containing protein 6 [Epinephelus lanceolatus]|uniref:ankyrin repeat domain-containing protein 6 isoform X1 n=1 Tax=Epinephelus lanceolatus TaxID=310571 RepID=UPI0014478448|nr:ankyrin repeat domain-containing protein 6 isoform X1 [Epinephelus lanceolatus]XP_033497835.1 ankyrin repeat domain-containing protein 6 isoform X1 [Epinephelus lanceolatus]
MSEQALVHVPSSPCQGPGYQTALHRAATVGNSDAMAALIQGGCAVDLQDKDGNTALHEVSWHGFSQCVKLLVKSGADVHIRNKAGNTALHLACQNAHAQTARLLLLGGSTPDTKNNMGDTCLHVAARYNNLTLVKLLLGSLCSVTERNQSGDTALHVAAALNHKKTVQLLLEAGIDGKIRNNAGKTALDKARDNNHKDLAHLLARAPQVHRFMRGRTIRKRRERLTAERRTQSVTRVDILPNKDSSSAVEETPSSEKMESRTVTKVGPHHHHQQQHYKKNPAATISSPYSHRKRRRVREQALNRNDLRKGKNDFHAKKNLLWDDGEDSAENGKIYQLYTLYRDKDGNIRQAPANGCHCKPLLKKLEGQLKATQEEMRLHILNIQEEVNCRLGKMDHRNKHQMKVLDMLNQERAAAERKNIIYKIEQRAAQGKEEALMTQAAVTHELKRWCMSQLKDMDVHIAAKSQYYKLLPSQSVEQSVADADLESLPLLSVVSGDSSTSLATYVNILPSKSTNSVGGQEQEGSRTYFEMKVDRSPEDYENTALFPLHANHSSGILLGTVDPLCQHPGVQDSSTAAVVPLYGEGFSSSSSQSSISDGGPRPIQQQQFSSDRQERKHFGELMSAGRHTGVHSEGSRTLEFFIDRPTEPTFRQERNNQHAMEVTQRFFETVSTQLERWYERKLVEVEQQTELRAQQDRRELLQQISMLEEELERLKTNEKAEGLCTLTVTNDEERVTENGLPSAL